MWVYFGPIANASKGASVTLAPGDRVYCSVNDVTLQDQVSITGTSGDAFFAAIDTTFALYEPGAGKWDGVHIRLDFPYVVEHMPWYIPTDEPHAERDFYKATAIPGISHSQ